jgi:hypothetical protein
MPTNTNAITTTLTNNATNGLYQPRLTGTVPHKIDTTKIKHDAGNIVCACTTKSQLVAMDDNTVLSAMGLAVLPNVDPANTAPAACITKASSPALNEFAKGKMIGNKIPIVPMALPDAKLTSPAINVAITGNHFTFRAPPNIELKNTDVCNSLTTAPNAHASNKINKGSIISLKPVVHAATNFSKVMMRWHVPYMSMATAEAAAALHSKASTESALATMSTKLGCAVVTF